MRGGNGRDRHTLIIASGILGLSAAAAIMLYRRQPKENGQTWLSGVGLQRIPHNKAAIFRLDYVNRINDGNFGGAGSQRCSDTGTDIPVEHLVDVPGLVVYSIELVEGEILLMFMQVPSLPELLKRPFLDRGVRALAEIGSKVYVARMGAVEKIPGLTPFYKLSPSEQSRISIVWNTGRCGSTLMHKMLQVVGVLSMSEPFWQDRLSQLRTEGMDGEVIARAFGICGAMDLKLVRKYLPSVQAASGSPSTIGQDCISINPKAKSYSYMEPVVRSLPHARHLFMYRDVREVAESFISIFTGTAPARGKFIAWVASKMPGAGSKALPPPRRDPVVISKAVHKARMAGAIPAVGNPRAKGIATSWLENMCLWRELKEDRVAAEGNMIALRMSDFTRKDPRLIEDVLRFVLGESVEVGEDAVSLALEVFKKHSQAGDRMENSSFNPKSGRRRSLTPKDLEEINALVRAIPLIGSPDFVLPGSLGAEVAPAKP